MAKRTDIKRIMIIGSGPIVIGQAAEFDYAGTQACLALKDSRVIFLMSYTPVPYGDVQFALRSLKRYCAVAPESSYCLPIILMLVSPVAIVSPRRTEA